MNENKTPNQEEKSNKLKSQGEPTDLNANQNAKKKRQQSPNFVYVWKSMVGWEH